MDSDISENSWIDIQMELLCIISCSCSCYEGQSVLKNKDVGFLVLVNPLMPGGSKKVTHTYTNLQLNSQRSAVGLCKYVWPFCYHQALKG